MITMKKKSLANIIFIFMNENHVMCFKLILNKNNVFMNRVSNINENML